MPGGIDPSLLVFAGRFLSQGGGDPGNGFGNALGAGLEAAGSQQLFKQEQERTRKADLVKNAESSIALRRAMQELQVTEDARAQQKQQQTAQQDFLTTLPEDQRAAAAVNPEQAALLETEQANPAPITPYQQEQLARNDRNFEAGQEQLAIDNMRADQKFDFERQKLEQKAKPSGEDISRLRKEYTGSSKDFGAVRDGYKKILATDDTAAGDLSLVFSYMKMLDPTSVVREQEYANAKNAAGVPDIVRNQYNKLVSGQFLGDQQRMEFRQQADSLYQAQYDTQMEQKTAYGEIASRGGIDVRDVTQQVYTPTAQDLKAQHMDNRIKKLGLSLSTLDQASQETGIPIDKLLRAVEAKRAQQGAQ